MCWLGPEAMSQAKPSAPGQAKAKPPVWLVMAHGSGFNFRRPKAMAQAMAFAHIFVNKFNIRCGDDP